MVFLGGGYGEGAKNVQEKKDKTPVCWAMKPSPSKATQRSRVRPSLVSVTQARSPKKPGEGGEGILEGARNGPSAL